MTTNKFEFEYADWLIQKYQKTLISILNTKEGRDLQGISKEYQSLPIVEVGRNHISFFTGKFKAGKPVLKGIFYTGSFGVARIWTSILEKALIADKGVDINSVRNFSGIYKDNFYPDIFCATTNFSTGAKDTVLRRLNEVTWTAARDAATGDDVITGATTHNVLAIFAATYYLYWAFLPADTSGLGAATLGSARQFINVGTVTGAGGTYDLIESTIADATIDPTTTDFNLRVFTDLGNLSITTTGNKFITLNATGMTKIVKNGYTKIGLTDNLDVTNSAPVGDNQITFDAQENGTPANRPYLEVTYTPTAAGMPFMIY